MQFQGMLQKKIFVYYLQLYTKFLIAQLTIICLANEDQPGTPEACKYMTFFDGRRFGFVADDYCVPAVRPNAEWDFIIQRDIFPTEDIKSSLKLMILIRIYRCFAKL